MRTDEEKIVLEVLPEKYSLVKSLQAALDQSLNLMNGSRQTVPTFTNIKKIVESHCHRNFSMG
jgi:uncharacterized NAD-dependent epimerase/dehydratase family protein